MKWIDWSACGFKVGDRFGEKKSERPETFNCQIQLNKEVDNDGNNTEGDLIWQPTNELQYRISFKTGHKPT